MIKFSGAFIRLWRFQLDGGLLHFIEIHLVTPAWHYAAPGKPQQNTFAESFIGRLRDEMSERDAVHLIAAGTC
jgi:hypothetical protein